jgi:hypothetical protein
MLEGREILGREGARLFNLEEAIKQMLQVQQQNNIKLQIPNKILKLNQKKMLQNKIITKPTL